MNRPFLVLLSVSLLVCAGSVGCSRQSMVPVSIEQVAQQPPAPANPQPAPPPPPLDQIRLPDGFRIAYFASDVPGARSLCRGDGGTIFVGTRGEGRVYAMRDANGDHHADEVVTIARGLNMPNGVAFADGALYVAEISRILRFDNIEQRLSNPPSPQTVKSGLPTQRSHGWKFIAFGPDGKLYVPVGYPGNIGPRREGYGNINRMNRDGSGWEVFAVGLRNTLGFDWEPQTNVLWFTDNGRDRMGDDQPPDELNRAPRPGMDFGFPYCHGQGLPDPQANNGRDCSQFVPAEHNLGPHVAALGMRFYTGTMFPQTYRGGIFIAEHGSWDRSTPIGYRVMYVPVANGRARGYEVFAQGWLQGRSDWGRPVDVLVMPDGALLVSDDSRGCVYRISYAG